MGAAYGMILQRNFTDNDRLDFLTVAASIETVSSIILTYSPEVRVNMYVCTSPAIIIIGLQGQTWQAVACLSGAHAPFQSKQKITLCAIGHVDIHITRRIICNVVARVCSLLATAALIESEKRCDSDSKYDEFM
jgi:hypothetical protein